MEEYPTAMNNEPSNPKPNRLHALAFLKVGIFEIGFAAVMLFLLFGILNYFNLLSVSNAFPNQFNWLPRQINNLTIEQNVTPSPANFTPNTFTYDTAKAKTLLTQYIKDAIKPEFLPANIEIKQGLSIDGRTEDIKYEFGSMFTANQASFSANFHYKEKTSTSNDFSIFIQPESITQATATAPLANSLLSSYFTSPYSISNCQQKGTTSYCENFQTLTEGKRGYGIISAKQGIKSISIVFNCFVPKESKDYDALKSCITP